jgi:hypothetical protein
MATRGLRLSGLERIALGLAAILLVVFSALAGKPHFTNSSRPLHGIESSWVALQSMHDTRDVDAILYDVPSPDREVLRLKSRLELVFAAVASAMLLAVMVSLVSRRGRSVRLSLSLFLVLLIGWLASEVVLLWQFLKLADTPLSATTPELLESIRFSVVARWVLTAGLCAFLYGTLFGAMGRVVKWLAVVNLLAGLVAPIGFGNGQLWLWAAFVIPAVWMLDAATLKFVRYEPASSNPVPSPLRSN